MTTPAEDLAVRAAVALAMFRFHLALQGIAWRRDQQGTP